jgi:hypothetical protein
MIPANDPLRQVRYLQSIACLVEDAAKRDELQQRANSLLAEHAALRDNNPQEGGTLNEPGRDKFPVGKGG